MPAPEQPFAEGDEVTLIAANARVTSLYVPGRVAVVPRDPYPFAGDHGVTVLPGGDVRGILHQALLDAAELHEPIRCVVCVEAEKPCDGCQGDEGKVRAYRTLAAAFGELEPGPGEAGHPGPSAGGG